MKNRLDEIMGVKIPVLDEGFVRVVDYMGDDAAIVQAARVSYGKGTKTIRDDESLIRYLMRHEHTSPFEMCEIKLHVKVPMYIWRQWIRHRTASVNEVSGRYSIIEDVVQKTQPGQWRTQSKTNKQGSSDYLPGDIGMRLSEAEFELHEHARAIYEERLKEGVAREQARKDLPLSTYTEAYWKIDLRNLLHFLKLRMDEHAQYEIREYANVIGWSIVERWVPITWKAFTDYYLRTIKLSKPELDIIQDLNQGSLWSATKWPVLNGLIYVDDYGQVKFTGEFRELLDKLLELGYSPELVEDFKNGAETEALYHYERIRRDEVEEVR